MRSGNGRGEPGLEVKSDKTGFPEAQKALGDTRRQHAISRVPGSPKETPILCGPGQSPRAEGDWPGCSIGQDDYVLYIKYVN